MTDQKKERFFDDSKVRILLDLFLDDSEEIESQSQKDIRDEAAMTAQFNRAGVTPLLDNAFIRYLAPLVSNSYQAIGSINIWKKRQDKKAFLKKPRLENGKVDNTPPAQ